MRRSRPTRKRGNRTTLTTDQLIKAHSVVEKLWTYNRLFDYRHAIGHYEYEDVKRLKSWWVDQKPPTAPLRKTAIISPDALTRARINTFDPALLHKDENRAFENIDEAIDWLKVTRPMQA